MLTGLVWLCWAQAAAPDAAMLARIRQHMAAVLSSMPNYTCEQTVERALRPARERRFKPVDTLRLEVSFVEGREMFAWPGAERFEDARIDTLVSGGAIGTGAFAMHADIVFRSDAPVFTFRGEGQENGRKTVQYDFRVPLARSRFYVKGGPNAALVGYHGSFWADAATLDLIRLQIEADDIPAKVAVKESGSTVEYGRRHIGESDFLLPVASEMRMVDLQGNENRNLTQFGACRRYAGSVSISFGDPAALPAEPAKAAVIATTVPAGLTVELDLAAPVRGEGVAVGDPVTALAARDTRKDNAIAIPKGARFHGRVTRVERRDRRNSPPYFVVGLRFDRVEFGNRRAPFRGQLEQVNFGNQSYFVPFAPGPPPPLNAWSSEAQRPLAPATAGEGVLFTKAPLHLPARMRMVWRTLP